MKLSSELKEKIKKGENLDNRTIQNKISIFCEWILPKVEKLEQQNKKILDELILWCTPIPNKDIMPNTYNRVIRGRKLIEKEISKKWEVNK